MNKDYNEIICIDSKGAEGFIEDISKDDESMTVGELINYLETLSAGDHSKRIYLSNDEITYVRLDTSKFDLRII